jgi:hypothetical protein
LEEIKRVGKGIEVEPWNLRSDEKRDKEILGSL